MPNLFLLFIYFCFSGVLVTRVMEIGPVSYPDSLFASCRRLLYPYADRSRHVWNPSPSLRNLPLLTIKVELGGAEASTTVIQQLSLHPHLVYLHHWHYIFFFHLTTSFLPLWIYKPFFAGFPCNMRPSRVNHPLSVFVSRLLVIVPISVTSPLLSTITTFMASSSSVVGASPFKPGAATP